MLIKMLTLQAGPTGVREPGKVYEVSDKEGKALVEGGYATKAEREAPRIRAIGRRGQEQTAETETETPEEG